MANFEDFYVERKPLIYEECYDLINEVICLLIFDKTPLLNINHQTTSVCLLFELILIGKLLFFTSLWLS